MARVGAVHRTVWLGWGGHYGTVEVRATELETTRKQLEEDEEEKDNNSAV